MKTRDYDGLRASLADDWRRRSPRSQRRHGEAARHLVDGGSHGNRNLRPFPPSIVRAQGAWLDDEDGHRILDFWQGHLANILGDNPGVVTSVLARAFWDGSGLQSGCVEPLEAEVAELICRRTGAEGIRFTTSGTLANTYAVMLSMAWTGREHAMKVGGGWHGAHLFGLKGVRHAGGFDHPDSQGLPSEALGRVIVTRFNDPQRLEEDFRRLGDRLACFTLEPMVGAGGLIPVTREYLQAARRLADRHGVVLILDEVITGFRFRAGDAAGTLGVRGDLTVLGKIIGGGMPVAAVAGRREILELAGRTPPRVAFNGGTYSAHPAGMLAAKAMLTHLVDHEKEVYPRLARLGAALRAAIVEGFGSEGVRVHCTGAADDFGGSSLAFAHFPYRDDTVIDSPDVALDPARCDVRLARDVLETALLLEDVLLVHAHGAASMAHRDEDIRRMADACRRTASRLKPFL
jgi:glutamate-1-semialdehyde 2,1-aminomutase